MLHWQRFLARYHHPSLESEQTTNKFGGLLLGWQLGNFSNCNNICNYFAQFPNFYRYWLFNNPLE